MIVLIAYATICYRAMGAFCLTTWFPIIAILMLSVFLGVLIYTIVKTNLSIKRMDEIEQEVKLEIKSLRELNK